MLGKYEMELEDRLPKLVKEAEIPYGYEPLDSPGKIAEFVEESFGLTSKCEEHVYMLAFDIAMNPMGVFFIAKGAVNDCICSARSIFQRAFMVGASNVAVIHNHPSGNLAPSNADFECAKRLYDAGRLLEINLIDFMIVGRHPNDPQLYVKSMNLEKIGPFEQ